MDKNIVCIIYVWWFSLHVDLGMFLKSTPIMLVVVKYMLDSLGMNLIKLGDVI